jgi:hypothetical protein
MYRIPTAASAHRRAISPTDPRSPRRLMGVGASDPNRPPLSIIIPSIEGWPKIQVALASVELAARRVGAEVIVADGSGGAAPQSPGVGSTITWKAFPGYSVFQLRHEGYRRATAAVIAVTEDHCHVPEDWAERILASHIANPDAAAIGGSVENGATGSLVDWASFFSLQTRYMPPIRSGPTNQINGHVNVSYKREALVDIDPFGGLGALDQALQRRIREVGAILVADDGIRCARRSATSEPHGGTFMRDGRSRGSGAHGWTDASGCGFCLPSSSHSVASRGQSRSASAKPIEGVSSSAHR